MNAWLIIFNLCVIAFTSVALVTDVRNWRLPNWLTVPAFIAGILFHAMVGWIDNGSQGVVSHLTFSALGFAVGFGILFVAWLIGSNSAGDAKLMGAVGAWMGPLATFAILVLSAVFEVCRLIVVFLVRSTKRGFRGALEEMKSTDQKKKKPTKTPKSPSMWTVKVPYAVSAVAATWCVLLAGTTLTIVTDRALSSTTRYWSPQSDLPELAPTEK